MKKLLNIELQKIVPYTVFWVITGLMTGLFIMVIFVMATFKLGFGGVDVQNLLRFPYVWNSVAWIASWFNLFFSVLIIILAGNEFSYRTFRRQFVDGLQREDFVTGKLILILLLACASVVLVFATSLVCGFVFSPANTYVSIFNHVYYLLIYFIQAVAYMSFALLIAVLLRNTALSFVIYFVYFIFEGILRIYFAILGVNWSAYLPMKIISNLTPQPEITTMITDSQFKNSIQYSNIQPHITESPMYLSIFLALVYVSIFIFVSYYSLKKKNL